MLQADASVAGPDRLSPDAGISWGGEIRATLALAWPLVIAQLATMAIHTTDVIMVGWLGPTQLAAGTLATALIYPFLMFGTGVVTAVSPMIAQAIGARQYRSVRRTTRQGLWMALALAALLIPIVLQAEHIFLQVGQAPDTAALSQSYIDFAVWLFVPALLFMALRGLVAAHGLTSVVLWVTLIAIVLNALGNYALMFGNFGLPRLELRGAGITTSLVHVAMFAMLLGYAVSHRRLKRYSILARFWKPDSQRFFAILRLGAPIGLMMAAEVGMFTAAAMLMGWLGTDQLAAHAVALQLAALSFMVPLGISHAATIRVGIAHGAGHGPDIAKAGWTAIALACGFMAFAALLFISLPGPLIHLFFDARQPENAAPIALAVGYLSIAALFQLVDGAQVSAAAALRGISDTTMPMVMALVGYWVCGLPMAWLLGFPAGLEGIGIWLGLAFGLAVTAVTLTVRFMMRERFGLVG
ncbi:MAG TPA: MATE family efflux transporter [Afifellaceae bacterium]|nr:MATE family efflux transporter [Afifellaceae bacterium]